MSKQDTVVAEIEIAASPEKIFRALTDEKQLFIWWGYEPSVDLRSFNMDARVGGRWSFKGSDKMGHPVNGVTEFEAHGEILELAAPRLLVYSWIANWHDHPEQTTVVRWELEKTKSGTRVRVTHSGLAKQDVARKGYTQGWPGVLRLLEKFFQR